MNLTKTQVQQLNEELFGVQKVSDIKIQVDASDISDLGIQNRAAMRRNESRQSAKYGKDD